MCLRNTRFNLKLALSLSQTSLVIFYCLPMQFYFTESCTIMVLPILHERILPFYKLQRWSQWKQDSQCSTNHLEGLCRLCIYPRKYKRGNWISDSIYSPPPNKNISLGKFSQRLTQQSKLKCLYRL